MVQTKRHFWSSWGHYYGYQTYDTAIGKNANISWNSYYYFCNGGRSSWHRGKKVSGASDPIDWLDWEYVPKAIRDKANSDGTPKPATVGTQATAGANASGSVAGINANSGADFDSNPNYHRVMKLGVKDGADIAWVRQKLGVPSSGTGWSNPNGHWDGNLTYAVKIFQTNNGLTSDGIVGPKTACKLKMPGAPKNCNAAPAPTTSGSGGTSGGTSGGGGGTVTTPTPVKPPSPYKLPPYVPADSGAISAVPWSEYDVMWAQFEVFNAYQLATIQHNQYFETIQPSYNVISNTIDAVVAMDQQGFLFDDNGFQVFLETNDALALYSYGVGKDSNTIANKKFTYVASSRLTEDLRVQQMTLAVKFISHYSFVNIADQQFKITYIEPRMGRDQAAIELQPVNLRVTALNKNQVTVDWDANPSASYYYVYETKRNGVVISNPARIKVTSTSYVPAPCNAGTTNCYKVEAYKSITGTINNPVTAVKIGESVERCATTPNISIPAPATFIEAKAVLGKTRLKFKAPTPTTDFHHVRIVIKEGSYPTNQNDGTAYTYAASYANQYIYPLSIGTGDRPTRCFYIRMWTYNSSNEFNTTYSDTSVCFMQNPAIVRPLGRHAHGTVYGWEKCCYRQRTSNFGSSVGNDYNGIWWYGAALKDAMAGRQIRKAQLHVVRADGGSGGAIPLYLGTHNYATQPAGRPTISNIYVTPETVARNSTQWIDITRWAGLLSNGSIFGIGMDKAGHAASDLHTWVGQVHNDDGVVFIYHDDYAS